MREIFWKSAIDKVSKQVKQRKTAIHESIHHQFIAGLENGFEKTLVF